MSADHHRQEQTRSSGHDSRRADADGPSDDIAPSSPSTMAEQLEWGRNALAASGSRRAAAEAAGLLACVLGLPRLPDDAAGPTPLDADAADAFLVAIGRRVRDCQRVRDSSCARAVFTDFRDFSREPRD